jgi:hypothetical protein
MKTVSMTPTEFVSFKQLATFFFDICIQQGFVHVTANIDHLEQLGY